jgi:hypothetical protein
VCKTKRIKKFSNTKAVVQNQLSISSVLVSYVFAIKVNYSVTSGMLGTTSAPVSSVFIAHHKPYNGTCSVDKTSGFSMNTYFNISCQNYTDPGGVITNYAFYGKNKYIF